MKYLSLLLLLLLFGCKSETKNETGIDESVVTLWDSFIFENPEFKNNDRPEAWFFHNNEKDANRLAALTLSKKKQAGSGLYAWYKEAQADLPQVGTQHIITDFNGTAKAIIEITKVDTIPFNQITPAYATLDMGTTEEPLEKWKKAHWEFFASTLEEAETKPSEGMLVVCEWFETIWPKN
ncbi:ASCH domain-containing protein [Aurantibacter sp.]|uniref:ASCH domain-containing protein n=1 Tax=Aurantibacter sp. TaxID=2807103 RepID=UPI0032671FAE